MKNIFKICFFIAVLASHQAVYSKNKGLEWGDNSCYFDASIQALSTLNDFNEDLGRYNPKDDPPTSTYLNLINLIKGKFTTDDTYLNSDDKIDGEIFLRDFHLEFSQELPRKNEPTGQKDAPEFILKIFNGIETSIPELKQKFKDQIEQSLKDIGLTGKDLSDSVQAQFNQLHNPFDRIGFQTLNKKVCLSCNQTNEQIEPHRFLILNFDFEEIIDIKNLLKTDFRETQISDYTCEKCQKKGTCNSVKKVANLPKYLIIHLSRNQVNKDVAGNIILDESKDPTYKLVSTPVTFAFEINLNNISNILTDDIKKELLQKPFKYRLNAVIVHGGESVNSGHYWAYAKSSESKDTGSWYLYNDQHIFDAGKDKDLNPNSLIVKVMQTGLDNNISGYPNATPYVLFYELTEVVKGETDFDINWPTSTPNTLQQKLVQLKASLQELKAKLQTLQGKLGELRGKLK